MFQHVYPYLYLLPSIWSTFLLFSVLNPAIFILGFSFRLFMERIQINPRLYPIFLSSRPCLASVPALRHVDSGSRGFFLVNSCPLQSAFVPPQPSHLAYLFNFCNHIYLQLYIIQPCKSILQHSLLGRHCTKYKAEVHFSGNKKKVFKDGMVSI